MNLNSLCEEVLRKHRSVNSVANENSIVSSNLNRWIRFYVELETRVF
jgi:transposase-like protein